MDVLNVPEQQQHGELSVVPTAKVLPSVKWHHLPTDMFGEARRPGNSSRPMLPLYTLAKRK